MEKPPQVCSQTGRGVPIPFRFNPRGEAVRLQQQESWPPSPTQWLGVHQRKHFCLCWAFQFALLIIFQAAFSQGEEPWHKNPLFIFTLSDGSISKIWKTITKRKQNTVLSSQRLRGWRWEGVRLPRAHLAGTPRSEGACNQHLKSAGQAPPELRHRTQRVGWSNSSCLPSAGFQILVNANLSCWPGFHKVNLSHHRCPNRCHVWTSHVLLVIKNI